MYNQAKASTWDQLFFRKEIIPSEKFTILESKNPFLELRIDISHFDKPVQEKLEHWATQSWTQDQYLLHYQHPGCIEPKTGWGVTLNKKLIYPSLGFASAPHVHKPDFIGTYFRKRKITRLRKVISLRDTGEENYFHFFNDVLSKLYFIQDNSINLKDYTIVVSDKLYTKKYFSYILTHKYLSDLNWHRQQPHEWIQFEEVIFCKPFTHTKKYFDRTVEMVKEKNLAGEERRVFLTRSSNSLRFIENTAEIEPILKQFNFSLIDTSQMSFEDQIILFNNCRYLIGIHGAGLVNMIFRAGKPMSVLEVAQPISYIPFHYIMLSKMYGYDYDLLTGSKGRLSGEGGFRLDPEKLAIKISTMLKS
jgi:hypothetical protein